MDSTSPSRDIVPFTLPPHEPANFGLIQERILLLPSSACTTASPPSLDSPSHPPQTLYPLLLQHILWNQTRGLQALPILLRLLTLFPTPLALSHAPLSTLTTLLHPIGLHNIRASRLLAFAQAWLAAPPCKEKRYRKLNYPVKGYGGDVRLGKVLGEDDEREGWEIAHLPGVGAYALDGYRIFLRDKLRGAEEGVERGEKEAEWMRVVPVDKDLRRYLVWRWSSEGWKWDSLTGRKTKLSDIGGDTQGL